MTCWSTTLEPAPDEAIHEAVAQALVADNTAAVGDGGRAPLAVTVRDPAGDIVGGLWGYTWHGVLHVQMLALGEARGGGMGRQVMALAEAEARRRGCGAIWLDTFTFQAPWFYPKLGFEEFGRIAGYPPGHDRIFFLKRLA